MAVTFPINAQTAPAVKSIDGLIDALRKTGKEAGMSEKEINDMVNAAKKGSAEGAKSVNKMNESMGGLNSTITKVGGVLATVFALDRIKAFIGQIVTVTAEFQKLEAVLTNTLGSRGAAQRALADIQNFAAKTPFSVLQLTDSFVKLANQGFKPTLEQMRKLGDIASSQAKGFDQLTEAIIDAQTGEFERLKEFGIRASKEGDKVTFTFKGVQTQTDFTADSIREYILALGDAEGVSGSMAAISETLSGKISNLGDSWDKLLNTIGSREDSQRITNNFLTFLSNMLGDATDLVISKEQELQQTVNNFANQAIETYKASGMAFTEYLPFLEKELELQDKRYRNTVRNTNSTQEEIDADYLKLQQAKGAVIAVKEYNDELEKTAAIKAKAAADKAFADSQKAEKKRLEEIVAEYEKLRRLTDQINEDARFAFERAMQVNPKELTNVGATDEFSVDLPEAEATSNEGLKTLADIEQQKQDLRQQTFDHALGLANDLFNASRAINQQELGMLQYRYQQEIMMAGDNQEAKDKITRDYQKKQYEIQNKQMKLQNEQAIFQILSSQGPAVAKTIGENGFPAALPFLLLVAAQFGLLLNNQRKLQPPRFAATGDFDIQGPGSETSDSIPYFLSRRETVEPAHATKRFGAILEPMMDPAFNWYDLRNIVDKKLPRSAAPAINIMAGADSPELVEELRATRRAIENKKETRFHFDENGFGLWMGRGQEWTKYVKSRYSM